MRLSNFNSVFQISVGLHLGYALLSDLREYQLRDLIGKADAAGQAANGAENSEDASFLNSSVNLLRTLIRIRRREIKRVTNRMQAFCVFVAAFSLIILIISGIFPDWPVSACGLSLLLGATLFPMPLFCILTYVSHRNWRKSIRRAEDDVDRGWATVMGPILVKFQQRFGLDSKTQGPQRCD